MMASTPESIAQQNAAIAEALKVVTAAAETYQAVSTENASVAGIEASGQTSEAHGALVLSALKLVSAARGPLDSAFAHFENAAHIGAVRALLEMGVVDALPSDGSSMKADAIAEKLKVDPILIVRLMRCATLVGPFKETAPEEYAHTPYSQIYQVSAISGLTKLIFADGMFFKETGFKNPTSEMNNPYTFAHRTGGKTMWEYMANFPDRTKAFNYAMQTQTQATAWTVAIYPFADELSKSDTNDDTVLLIDVGGGKGHVAEQIRTLTKFITGRVILQDLPKVIDDISEPLPGVERMKYDFFTTQPVKGALIYYIRHCLHDWTDEKCIEILKVIAAAMEPGISRLAIAEIIIPASGANLEAGWMDLTMMTLTGSERTLKQWEAILDGAGLKLSKTYSAAGTNYGVVEAYLK